MLVKVRTNQVSWGLCWKTLLYYSYCLGTFFFEVLQLSEGTSCLLFALQCQLKGHSDPLLKFFSSSIPLLPVG